MMQMFIEPPEKLSQLLDIMHNECGVGDVESVVGGTQVNLSGCQWKILHKFLRQIPNHERISGIWTTRIKKGGYHISHNHPDGRTSGVYYLRTGDGGELRLGDETITPKPGLLIEFDSKTQHGTLPFKGEGTRLTIAFDMK